MSFLGQSVDSLKKEVAAVTEAALSNDPALDAESQVLLNQFRTLNTRLSMPSPYGSMGGMSNAQYKGMLRREGRGR